MRARSYLMALATAAVTAVCLAQTTVTDDLGREVSLAAPPARVIALVPSHTETVCALGACASVVGVDRYSAAEGLGDVPRVGDPYAPDIEAIVALQPDLVLVDEYSGLHQALADLGITVYAGTPQTVAETYAYIAAVGELLGRRTEAAVLVGRLEGELAGVAAVLADVERPSVFLELDATPYSAGPGSYLDEILVAAGGANVVPSSLGAFPQVDPEFVVAAAPEVIVLLDAPFGVGAADVAARPGWDALPAVTNGRVVELTQVQADALSRAGPRLGEAVMTLAAILHPGLF